MKLSIVTTLYRSSATVEEFYRRSVRAAEALGYDLEVIMVNDGSPDDSLDRALRLQRNDSRLVVVDLSRNFGHHRAMMTGLSYASGDPVFLIDSDLEEEPELLGPFYARLSKGDCDVVYGYQVQRRGGILDRAAGALYYILLDLLSDERIPRNVLTIRLMTADYVRALVRHRDRAFQICELWSLTGYRQIGLPTKKLSISATSYSFRRRLALFVSHVTTSSTKLLYIIFYLGMALSLVAAGAIGFYVLRYIFSGIGVNGFTSIIVSVWFFGGLITLILGIISIYIANVMAESKRRPYTVVRRVHRAPKQSAQPSNVASAVSVARASAGSD